MKITKPEHLDRLDKDDLIAFLQSIRNDSEGKTALYMWNKWRGAHNWDPVDLQGANLNSLNLQGVILGFTNLQEANLYGANLVSVKLNNANLEGAKLQFAHLEGAILSRASLVRAKLYQADLARAELSCSNLEGADLADTNMTDADLRLAHLRDVALSPVASLRGVHLYQTYFCGVLSLRYKQFLSDNQNARWLRRFWLRLWNRLYESTIWEETEGRFDEAKDVFKTLKGYFEDAGDYEGANWAYVREQVMEKLMRAPGWARWLYPRWRTSFDAEHRKPAFWEWFWLEFAEKAANYGTGILRPIFWLIIVVLFFALLYGLFGMITSTPGCSYAELAQQWRAGCAPTHNPLDALLFSLGALTSTEIGAVRPYLSHVGLLMTLEVLLGIALTGLFGFVLGNKLRYS